MDEHQSQSNSYSSLRVELVYEDESGARLADGNAIFFWAKVLLPYFMGQFGSDAIRTDLRESAKTLEVILTGNPVPNAMMKGVGRNPQIRINLGLYVALLSMSNTMLFLREIAGQETVTRDALFNLKAPERLVDELLQLMILWHKSSQSGWTIQSWPQQLIIPDPNYIFPALFFVMAHEFSHYYRDIILNRDWVEERNRLAIKMIDDFLVEKEYISARGLDDEAVREVLKDTKAKASWGDEIGGDQWAFQACMERFSPSYGGPRIGMTGTAATPLVYEPRVQSDRESRMYANIAAELVFGITKFLEAFADKMMGKRGSLESHPPATWRQELFVYTMARTEKQPMMKFMGQEYGSGLMTRIVMDSMLKQFVDRMENTAKS